MSNSKKSPRVEDLISTEDDTLGSSISLSIGENSVRIKEKPKQTFQETELSPLQENNLEEKWWLKKPKTSLAFPTVKVVEVHTKETPTPSPDVSSSMKEFLEKEKMCKALHKNETEVKAREKDDTLSEIFASVAFDRYPSDFENATDEDIGSILEEMSKIAGALSPNSGPDHTKSGNCSKNPTEEEKSVEELLEEAEKLVRKNSISLSKSASKSDTLVPDDNLDDKEGLGRVRQLEADIFQLIEQEVHKESEKIKRSPKNEKIRSSSPGFEMVYESLNSRKTPRTLEYQKKKFEEQKVEVSSSSDLDDPIEKHSKSEEIERIQKVEKEKENLQKEITDVDKDFFEDLLKRSKERAEGGLSGSSSFGQEDFSHFLRLLQGQADQKEAETNALNPTSNFQSSSVNHEIVPNEPSTSGFDKTPEFPEREISEILQNEILQMNQIQTEHEVVESDSSFSGVRAKQSETSSKKKTGSPKDSAKERIQKSESSTEDQIIPRKAGFIDSKKVINSKNELYTVDLTPRLELFADAIPKLLAEKSNQKSAEDNKEEVERTTENVTTENAAAEIKVNEDLQQQPKKTSEDSVATSSGYNPRRRVTEVTRNNRVVSAPDAKQPKKVFKFSKSRSYDQINKPPIHLRSSLENIKAKPVETAKRPTTMVTKKPLTSRPALHIKQVAKLAPRVTAASKLKKDPPKTGSTGSLASNKSSLKSPENALRNLMAGGDTKLNSMKHDWEALCREEKRKNAVLKQQLESETKMYKTQIENMRTSFEEEMFALKKQNIILKTKVDELSLGEKLPEIHNKKDTKVVLLEKELEKQESVIRTYETENKKLMQETKRLQEEIKNLQQKQKNKVAETNDSQKLADRVKDLEEQALKLNYEILDLRHKNEDYILKNDDLMQQNGLILDEVKMFKEQLRTKNNFITERLQAMTSAELELKKQMEEATIKLSSKTEQLRIMKMEYEKLQNSVLPLEKELLELRVKEGHLQEKLQVAKSHVEREKVLTQKLKDQVIIDNKRIIDLNRQVREMERILKRKNPDSVSALILTANSEQERISNEKVKLLEERISCLEDEIKSKEDVAQQKLIELQRKFTEMKEKYEAQINELDDKLLKSTMKDRKIYNDMFTQTVSKLVENKCIEARREEKTVSFEKDERRDQKSVKVGPKSQNVKEDTHLIATIRGMKLELMNKDKAMAKLTKECQELQKTNKRLQKEREKLLNDRKALNFDRGNRVLHSSDSRLANSKPSEGNDQNSNVYQNGHVSDANSHRLSASTHKLYDPMQYTENNDSNTVRRLTNENDILKEELNKMNKDFMALKNKRLHDLNLLQEEHEREMATLVKEYSIKFGDSKVVKLQGQINTQVAIISHLRQQIDKLRDYKEQVVVLRAEREHLESKVKSLSDKVKYLSSPGTEQLQLLQDKITMLQQRHESREMTLQTLVRDLLRSRNQCRDCMNEKNSKNRQLCYFRKELDHILGMLQEITDLH